MELPSSVIVVNPDVANVEVTATPGPLKVEKRWVDTFTVEPYT